MSSLITDNASARLWLDETLHVPRETIERLETFETLLRDEMEWQNLIAASTLDSLWVRHYVDSAQLLQHVEADPEEAWIDLGAGAGFPGIIIAILTPSRPVHLVESRALRCDFLQRSADALALDNVTVHHDKLERITAFPAGIISARAFAPLPKLIDLAERFATKCTNWVLPKGKNAVNELASLPKAWQRLFHVEQSITDPDSKILVGRGKAAISARK